MEVKCVTVGSMGVNCYILSEGERCCVVDPGDEWGKIMSVCEGMTVEKIILTHGHFDHINAAAKLKEKTGAKLYISEMDKPMLKSAMGNLYYVFYGSENGFNAVGYDEVFEDEIDICGRSVKVIDTPGHSPGSVCLLHGKMLISGDTLFYRTIGNYTFGDYDKLMQSLKKLMKLPDDVKVYPGHGSPTTIGEERLMNPYLR